MTKKANQAHGLCKVIAISTALSIALAGCSGGKDNKDAPQAGLEQKEITVEGVPVTVTWRPTNPVEAEAQGAIPIDDPVKTAALAIQMATGCAVPTEGIDFGRGLYLEADGNVRLTLGMDCREKSIEVEDLAVAQARADVTTRENTILAAAVESAVQAVLSKSEPAEVPVETTEDTLSEPAVAVAVTEAPAEPALPVQATAPAEPAEPVQAATPASPAPAPVSQPVLSDAVAVAAPPAPVSEVLPEPELFEGSPYAAFSKAMIERYCAQDWTTRVAANGRTEYNPCTQRSAFR